MSTAKPEYDVDVVALPSVALWRLDADPAALARSAAAWCDLAGAVTTTDSELTRAATDLLTGWTGEAAQAYGQHHGQVSRSLVAVSTVAAEVGATLDTASGVLRRAQDQLDASWGRLRLEPLTTASVAAATAEARQIRVRTDIQLDVLSLQVSQHRSQLWAHEVAAGYGEAENAEWAAPPELAGGGRVIVDGNRVIVNGTGGADDIEVGVVPSTREQYVTVNGVRQYFPADAQIIVRAGAGGDTVRVVSGSGSPSGLASPSGSGRVTVLGGAGKDTVYGGEGEETILGLWDADTILGGGGTDLVYGGSDDDYISGGDGDDVVDGGSGQDTVYGLGGADSLWGGTDQDMLDGGSGDDRVDGGRGDDVLLGGRGADTLLGGAGSDAVFAGAGADVVHGGGGRDHATVQAEDTVAGTELLTKLELMNKGDVLIVDPNATPEFAARVESDLEALRSTGTGQQMLAALQQSHAEHGDTLVITETDGVPVETGSPRTGVPVGASIEYNPSFTPAGPGGAPMRPVVVLYHELAHAYDDFYDSAAAGTYEGADDPGTPNVERQAVGLPIDDDGDPATPDRIDPDHPYAFTENGLRDELGLPPRPEY